MKEGKQCDVLFLQLNGKILHLTQFWKFLGGWRKFSFKLVILQMPLSNNDPEKRGVNKSGNCRKFKKSNNKIVQGGPSK